MNNFADIKPSNSLLENINVRMSEEHDLPFAVTKFRYSICATGRSGSNFLCSMLRSSGLAGYPLEYLNSAYVAADLKRWGKSFVDPQYLSKVETRRTSSNGIFGIKVMYYQLLKFFRNKDELVLNFLKSQNALIYLYRKNKLEQAISLFIAKNTNVYTSEDKSTEALIKFDGAVLTDYLNFIVQNDAGWQRLLQKNRFPYVSVCYEDLVLNTEVELRKIYKSFGIENLPTISESSLTKKLQHPQYEDLLIQFKKFLYC